ncbi:MAG: class I SAM-dependent methyltransferase [Planctomycetaceae bacterium]
MDEAVQQLNQLAAGAIAHAEFAHGQAIGDNQFQIADRILVAEQQAAGSDRSTVAACYGAWLGNWAVKNFAATWAGLDEPVAPRLIVHGTLCSPIDAVSRFLADPRSVLADPRSQRGLVWMANQIRSWAAATPAAADVHAHNAAAWDQLVDDDRFSGAMPLPADRQAAMAALDPWLRDEWKPGCRLLCLAAGGGRQGPLHAIAGAKVTVVDISQRQLEQDRLAAQRLGLSLSLIQCSADQLTGIEAHAFDVIVQPVSTCYLPDLRTLYREIARVLRPGGVYLVQHKQPTSMRLRYDPEGGYRLDEPAPAQHCLPIIRPGQLAVPQNREPGTMEYAHSLQDLIGELCAAGFLIERFAEPPRGDAFAEPGSAEHQACFAPPYFKLKAIRKA